MSRDKNESVTLLDSFRATSDSFLPLEASKRILRSSSSSKRRESAQSAMVHPASRSLRSAERGDVETALLRQRHVLEKRRSYLSHARRRGAVVARVERRRIVGRLCGPVRSTGNTSRTQVGGGKWEGHEINLVSVNKLRVFSASMKVPF